MRIKAIYSSFSTRRMCKKWSMAPQAHEKYMTGFSHWESVATDTQSEKNLRLMWLMIVVPAYFI